jgi:SAM-dependent methyltransferase
VVGVDPVPAYVAFARQTVRDLRAEFQTSAAEQLPFPDAAFDAVLACLVLQEVADPARALLEMARVARAGGRVAACTWDFDGGLPMQSIFWSAAEALAPAEVARRRARDNAIKRAGPQQLAEHWSRAGLCDMRTGRLELAMRFASFEDYWQPFLAGATPTSAFAAALNRESEGELERIVRCRTGDVQMDGSFELPARALAVAGIKP